MDIWSKVNEALRLFAQLSGVEPGTKKLTLKFGNSLSSYDISKVYEEIKKAEETEPTGMLRALLFDNMFQQWIDERSVTIRDLLSGNMDEGLDMVRRISDIMSSPEVTVNIIRYKEGLRTVLQKNGYEGRIIGNLSLLTKITASSVKIMEMKLKQFSRADGGDPGEIYISDTVLPFSDDAAAVKFAAGSRRRSFIAVCYVINVKYPIFSHFMFLVKRGTAIYILSDEVEFCHPGQMDMVSGRNGGVRFFEKNKSNGWEYFPYEIIDFFKDWFGVEEDDGTTAVQVGHQGAYKLNQIQEQSYMWLFLATQKIRQRLFGPVPVENEELHYFLAEQPEPVVEETEALSVVGGNLPVKWGDFTVPTLRFSVQEAIDVPDEAFDRKSADADHMIARYKGDIDAVALADSTLTDAPACGTEKELRDRAAWYARKNLAEQISAKVNKTYESDKEAAKRFLAKVAWKRRDIILRHMIDSKNGKHVNMYLRPDIGDKNSAFNHGVTIAKWDDGSCAYLSDMILFKLRPQGHVRQCPWYSDPMKYHYFMRFESLWQFEQIFGDVQSEKDFPQQLGLWIASAYKGNHMLTNIDPIDWVCWNPWDRGQGGRGFSFNIKIDVCEKAYRRLSPESSFPLDMSYKLIIGREGFIYDDAGFHGKIK
jgi:hypothetical protein